MHINQILEELAYDYGEFPREALESAILNKEEITPFLLHILEESIENIDDVLEDENYQGHIYALYLLAQFREKRAIPLLLKLISFPEDTPHLLFGDVITEDLDRLIASFNPPLEWLQWLIENPHVNEYVRAALLSSLALLVASNALPRDPLIAYLSTLFDTLSPHPSFIWDALITTATKLYPEELYEKIKAAFASGLITHLSFNEIAETLSTPKEIHLHALHQNAHLIDDTVTEMEKWLVFQ